MAVGRGSAIGVVRCGDVVRGIWRGNVVVSAKEVW